MENKPTNVTDWEKAYNALQKDYECAVNQVGLLGTVVTILVDRSTSNKLVFTPQELDKANNTSYVQHFDNHGNLTITRPWLVDELLPKTIMGVKKKEE